MHKRNVLFEIHMLELWLTAKKKAFILITSDYQKKRTLYQKNENLVDIFPCLYYDKNKERTYIRKHTFELWHSKATISKR